MSTGISLEKMTLDEKLELMERLWEDLSNVSSDTPSPAWHGRVLAERMAAVREGRTQFIPWEEAEQRLRERHK